MLEELKRVKNRGSCFVNTGRVFYEIFRPDAILVKSSVKKQLKEIKEI